MGHNGQNGYNLGRVVAKAPILTLTGTDSGSLTHDTTHQLGGSGLGDGMGGSGAKMGEMGQNGGKMGEMGQNGGKMGKMGEMAGGQIAGEMVVADMGDDDWDLFQNQAPSGGRMRQTTGRGGGSGMAPNPKSAGQNQNKLGQNSQNQQNFGQNQQNQQNFGQSQQNQPNLGSSPSHHPSSLRSKDDQSPTNTRHESSLGSSLRRQKDLVKKSKDDSPTHNRKSGKNGQNSQNLGQNGPNRQNSTKSSPKKHPKPNAPGTHLERFGSEGNNDYDGYPYGPMTQGGGFYSDGFGHGMGHGTKGVETSRPIVIAHAIDPNRIDLAQPEHIMPTQDYGNNSLNGAGGVWFKNLGLYNSALTPPQPPTTTTTSTNSRPPQPQTQTQIPTPDPNWTSSGPILNNSPLSSH